MTDELFNKRVGKYNYGLIIAIPCKDGTIPVEWFLHMDYVTHSMPVGLAWKYCFYKHLPVQEARQKCVEYARKERAKFILFIDDDTFIPVDSIVKMMRHQKDVVSGVVWTKRDPTEPVIFQECGLGPWYDFPKNQLVRIEAAGLACTLINMEIFDKLESPYFRIGWSRIQEGLENQKVSSTGTGEDTWFFQSCKNAEVEVYADTSVLCDHLDRQTGRIFPGEEVVNKYNSPEKDMYYKLKQVESNVVVVREHTREMTERCVDYIKINTRLRNNVTVVDKDFIEGQLYFGADLVYKDIIRGYELINKIYENLSGHYLVMLNDNVLVKDGWLSRMVQLQQKDGAAIVYNSPEKNIILIPYKTLTDHGKFEENYEEKLKSIGARIRFVEEKICDIV